MPAYRSAAEAEIRAAVVERIRAERPGVRIIHEINVSSFGPTRIDVLAVSSSEVLAVEIKSERDKLDRLPSQIEGMRGAAHHVVVALHEKFLVERTANKCVAHYERDGTWYMRGLPDGLDRHNVWVFPERQRAMRADYDFLRRWCFPDPVPQTPLPASAINLLWRDELYQLCGHLGVSLGKRPRMAQMISALRWSCTGSQVTRGVCAMLRARKCVEADPEFPLESTVPAQAALGMDV